MFCIFLVHDNIYIYYVCLLVHNDIYIYYIHTHIYIYILYIYYRYIYIYTFICIQHVRPFYPKDVSPLEISAFFFRPDRSQAFDLAGHAAGCTWSWANL